MTLNRLPHLLPDAQPGELYIQVYEPDRDSFGRVQFFQFWYDAGLPALGPADGSYTGTTRGQVFSADERPRITEALDRGDRVFTWPSGKEITTS
jgi:hypothetical protein